MYIKNNKLYTKIFRKQTDRQSSFYIFRTSEIVKRQYSIQSSTTNQTNLYNIRRLWTSLQGVETTTSWTGVYSELLDKHIKTVEKLDRKELIKGNKNETAINTRFPLAITFNRYFPNNRNIWKKWNILSVNKSVEKFFKTN